MTAKGKPPYDGPIPKCFHNQSQFTIWMAAARNTGGIREGGFCTDCTPEYQAAMLLKNNCINPLTTFTLDEFGFIQGQLPCNNPPKDSQTLDLFTDQQPPLT